jgi:hypothetical protein
LIRFIEHPTFTRQIEELLSVDEYKDFQRELAEHPEQGDVIPGLGGLRKVRVQLAGRGKRGGARVIYLLIPRPEIVFLFYAYSKRGLEDLNTEQKRRLKQAVMEIRREFT